LTTTTATVSVRPVVPSLSLSVLSDDVDATRSITPYVDADDDVRRRDDEDGRRVVVDAVVDAKGVSGDDDDGDRRDVATVTKTNDEGRSVTTRTNVTIARETNNERDDDEVDVVMSPAGQGDDTPFVYPPPPTPGIDPLLLGGAGVDGVGRKCAPFPYISIPILDGPRLPPNPHLRSWLSAAASIAKSLTSPTSTAFKAHSVPIEVKIASRARIFEKANLDPSSPPVGKERESKEWKGTATKAEAVDAPSLPSVCGVLGCTSEGVAPPLIDSIRNCKVDPPFPVDTEAEAKVTQDSMLMLAPSLGRNKDGARASQGLGTEGTQLAHPKLTCTNTCKDGDKHLENPPE
jgi:hypothetical protein